MAINRTLDFYTQMGPADVILAGYFEPNPPPGVTEEAALRITPRNCLIEGLVDAAGSRYRITFPGTGSLRVAGICFSYSPEFADIASTDILWPKWHYNNAERAVYVELRNQGGSAAPLPAGDKVYFCAHVYPSSEQKPNMVETP